MSSTTLPPTPYHRPSDYVINALPATSARFASVTVNHELALACFKADCIDTTKIGTYSNMWHIYGLSSV